MITRLSLAALIIASLFRGIAVSVTKYALGGFGPITLHASSAEFAGRWTKVVPGVGLDCGPPENRWHG